MLGRCASVAFCVFIFGVAFLCFCYGIAQLYEIRQKWVCSDGRICLNYTNDGTILSDPTTLSAVDYSMWNPTATGILYCTLFFIAGLGFITLVILAFTSKFCVSTRSISSYGKRKKYKYNNCCCFTLINKLNSFIPNRYNQAYSSCLWLISLQLKRCIFESLYLLQKGGINTLHASANIGVSNRVETKEKVLMFALLLGSNCIITSILYIFWWLYFKFSSLSFILLIVFIESIYDVLFSLFPVLSNKFQFGYMNFLDDATNFLTTYFPLLYLLYSVKNSMKYILPFMNKKNETPKIAQPNALEITLINGSNSDIDMNVSAANTNKNESKERN